MVHYISVSCLFRHYPSSNLIKSRVRDWLCLQVIKGKGQKGGDPSWWVPYTELISITGQNWRIKTRHICRWYFEMSVSDKKIK
jgi:hypothetical protein